MYLNEMERLLTLYLILCVLHITISVSENDESFQKKRLLLNDPDVINSRLEQMEKTLQDVNRLTTQLQTELAQEKHRVTQLQTALDHLSQDHGSTYIRWGRRQCSTVNTEIIYSGFAAGNEYSRGGTYGGAANLLCLSADNPDVSNRTGPGSSTLHGTEYQDGNFFKKGAEDEDVPCALCRSKNTSASVMIPGRSTCYAGWKMEYHGIIASNAWNHRASSYVCLDNDPEYLQAGSENKNGNLLYATTSVCGSLSCPPYVNGMVINCVVCSK